MRLNQTFCIKRLFFLFVIPTILVFIFSRYSGIKQQILNFELFFSAFLLSLRLTPTITWSTFILYATVFLIQVFQFLEYLYGLSLRDTSVHISAISSWPRTAYIAFASYLAVLIFVLVLLKQINRRDVLALPALGIITLFMISDILLSPSFIYTKDFIHFPNIIGSPILGEIKKSQLLHGKHELWENQPNSYLAIKNLIDKHQKDNSTLLIITLESLGIPNNNSDEYLLESHIKEKLTNYDLIEKFSEKTKGGTLNGELRLLCGIKNAGNISHFVDKRNLFDECIPNYVKKLGLASVAVHGNSGAFYDRNKIYPALGFDDFVSFESIPIFEKNTSCSKVFNAICDSQVTSIALDEKRRKNKIPAKIAYVMTIDTHFPLQTISKEVENGNQNLALNTYYSAVNKSISEISDSIRASNPSPDYVIIHGDHPPPFLDVSLRSQFKQNEVPVFIFRKNMLDQ